MNGRKLAVLLVFFTLLTASLVSAIGSFKIQYPFNTDVFTVDKDGNVTVTGFLDVTAGTADFADDAINESDLLFATSCAAGNHLYVNGNDLACEADADTGNCSGDQSCLGIVYDGNLSVYHQFADCAAGEYVQNTTATGVECGTPGGGGDITGVYTTGKYLENGSATGEVYLYINESNLNNTVDNRDTGNCSGDQSCQGVLYDGNFSQLHQFGDCAAGEFVQNTTATGVECDTPASAADVWVNETGDTMTGNLTMADNADIWLNTTSRVGYSGGTYMMVNSTSGDFIVVLA